jgi:hypothetical protein
MRFPAAPEARRVEADADERRGRDGGDERGLEREIGGVQKPERGARVEHVREIHQPRDDGLARIERQPIAHDGFGDLIDRHHAERQPEFDSPPFRRCRCDGRDLIHEWAPPAHPDTDRRDPPRRVLPIRQPHTSSSVRTWARRIVRS